MASVNKVILLGNIGQDPDVRYTTNEKAVANFSLATSRKYKGQDGQPVTDTEWHKIVVFGRLAEVVKDYCKRGSAIFIEGRLRTRKYQAKDGSDRWITEIVADSLQLLGSRNDDQTGAQSGARQSAGGFESNTRQRPSAQPYAQPVKAQGVQELDDDVPF